MDGGCCMRCLCLTLRLSTSADSSASSVVAGGSSKLEHMRVACSWFNSVVWLMRRQMALIDSRTSAGMLAVFASSAVFAGAWNETRSLPCVCNTTSQYGISYLCSLRGTTVAVPSEFGTIGSSDGASR